MNSQHQHQHHPHQQHVERWSLEQVGVWLANQGFGAYVRYFEMEGVTGDVLLHLTHETLRDLSVLSVGHRLGLLKAIYRLKLEHSIAIEPDDFVPQDIDIWTEDRTSRSYSASQDAKLHWLMDEVRRITQELSMLRDALLPTLQDIAKKSRQEQAEYSGKSVVMNSSAAARKESSSPQLFSSLGLSAAFSNHQVPNDPTKRGKPAALNLISSSNVKSGSRSPLPFLQRNKDKVPQRSPTAERYIGTGPLPGSPSIRTEAGHLAVTHIQPPKSPAISDGAAAAIRVYGDRLPGRENEAYKSFRITMKHTSQQILEMAHRKYDLTDDWHNYTLLIVHGFRGEWNAVTIRLLASSLRGTVKERYLGLEDFPLAFYQQLQQSGEKPIFVMRPNEQVESTGLVGSASASTSVPSRNTSLLRRSRSQTHVSNGSGSGLPPRRDSRRPTEPPMPALSPSVNSTYRHVPLPPTHPHPLQQQHQHTGSASSGNSAGSSLGSQLVINNGGGASGGAAAMNLGGTTLASTSLQATISEQFDVLLNRMNNDRID